MSMTGLLGLGHTPAPVLQILTIAIDPAQRGGRSPRASKHPCKLLIDLSFKEPQ